jgi:ankyrin repeat protein
MAQLRFAVPALVLVSLFSTVTARAASRVQPDDTRLPVAAQNGDQAEVQALLKDHVSVDSAEGDGSTALHWAAYQNNLALAQELLDAHANVNAVTRLESLTPLYMACESGSAPMVELLLKHGANVNQGDGLGTTPLMMAAASGNADVVKVLLDHGADVNAKEQAHQQTALMFAASLDRADVISALMAHGADSSIESKVEPVHKASQRKRGGENSGRGETPETAAKPGEKPVSVDAKQTAGADTKQTAGADTKETAGSVSNSTKISAGTTPKGDKATDEADAAKKPGADDQQDFPRLGAKFMGGMSPLLFAARQDNIPAGEALLAGGANINEVSGSEHTTPLVLAIMNGHYDFAKMLVEHGADVNLANDLGITPLWATEDVRYSPIEWSPEPLVNQEKTNYLALMKLLLAHGENPNARLKEEPWERTQAENTQWNPAINNPAGATAFYRAAQAWDVAAMTLLKDNGADPTLTTNLGSTPLMAAAGLGWAAMYTTTAAPTTMAAVQYCMSLGTNVNAQDKLGYTPLMAAAFMGDLKVIQYLIDHGADVKAKDKAGDTVADLANGLFEKSLLHPDAVALLVKLGSSNSNNCRSDLCVVPTKDGKPAAVASAAAASSKTPAAGSTTSTDVTLTTGKKPGTK